jgi:hypothetical protein
LAKQFRQQYGESATAESFLQRLLAQHKERPAQALGTALQLLSAAPEAVALAVLADAVEHNLCSPAFLELRLRTRMTAGSIAAVAPAPAVQLTLPRLEVERSLDGYGRALCEAGKEPA